MKKIILALAFIPMLSVATYADSNNAKNKTELKNEKTLSRVEAKQLISRLHEIKNIASTSKLTADQKQQYRNEVNNIKDRLEKMSGVYLYLSVTTIIIILLLLILL
jgi:hypothetical protein